MGRRVGDDLEALWALHPAGGPAPAGMGLMGVCTQPTAAPFTAMAGTAAMVHPSWSGPLVQQGMASQVNLCGLQLQLAWEHRLTCGCELTPT